MTKKPIKSVSYENEDDKEVYEVCEQIMDFLTNKDLRADLVVNSLASAFLTASVIARIDPALFALQVEALVKMQREGIEDWLRSTDE